MSTVITGEAKKSFKAIVVKELPEKGILNNLYFVLNGDEGDNKYDEYIWIKDPDTQQYMWEKVGYSYVDLTPYYTKTEIDGKLSPITAHTANYDNPHQVTKEQVGLGNVDNTADLYKPLSTNDGKALSLKIGSISIGSNAGGGLKLGLWGAKADGIVVGGQSINKVDLGTVVIPNVTADQDGLFPAAKLESLDSMQQQIYSNQHTIGQLNQNYTSLSASVDSIMGTKIPQIQDNFDKLKSTIGTSVININGDYNAETRIRNAVNDGYSLIRYAPHASNGPITIINEGDGSTYVQYKYEGGKQYRRESTIDGHVGDWTLIGPINNMKFADNRIYLGYHDGSDFFEITNVAMPILGSDTADSGLLSSGWFNIFKDNTLRSVGISYQPDYIDLGTIGTEAAYLNQVTTEKAGILSAEQWKSYIETDSVAGNAQNLANVSISSIVPTPSSDRITLKLKQNNGNTLDMPLVLVNTTNAGLMSPTDKSKLDGIESLASSDITALFS